MLCGAEVRTQGSRNRTQGFILPHCHQESARSRASICHTRLIRICGSGNVMPITLRQLQSEQREWVDHNFPKRADYYHLLGVMEELGELAHAHLKQLERIRYSDDLTMKEMDAIG